MRLKLLENLILLIDDQPITFLKIKPFFIIKHRQYLSLYHNFTLLSSGLTVNCKRGLSYFNTNYKFGNRTTLRKEIMLYIRAVINYAIVLCCFKLCSQQIVKSDQALSKILYIEVVESILRYFCNIFCMWPFSKNFTKFCHIATFTAHRFELSGCDCLAQ